MTKGCQLQKQKMSPTNGGVIYSLPPPFGCLWALRTSLHKEYFSTRKCRVGPLGVVAMRKFVLPDSDLEKSRRCVTPSGPVMVT